MMAKSVITLKAKQKMLEARKTGTLSKIKGIAIGDGAGSEGALQEPSESDTSLKNELTRKQYVSCTKISDTCYRYRIELSEAEQSGKKINEAALYDEAGDLLAIRVFEPKLKDADMEMAFEFDDKF